MIRVKNMMLMVKMHLRKTVVVVVTNGNNNSNKICLKDYINLMLRLITCDIMIGVLFHDLIPIWNHGSLHYHITLLSFITVSDLNWCFLCLRLIAMKMNTKKRFINFYSVQCGHCHDLAPEWRQVAISLQGVVKIGAVNCMAEGHLCHEAQLPFFPTLRLYFKGQWHGQCSSLSLLCPAFSH
jgi:hypothetical protein